DVDCHKDRLWYFFLLFIVGVDPALSRHHNAVGIAVFCGVVKSWCAAHNVDGVFVSPQKAIGAKVGDLLARMAGEVIGKGNFQRSPALPASPSCQGGSSSQPNPG